MFYEQRSELRILHKVDSVSRTEALDLHQQLFSGNGGQAPLQVQKISLDDTVQQHQQRLAALCTDDVAQNEPVVVITEKRQRRRVQSGLEVDWGLVRPCRVQRATPLDAVLGRQLPEIAHLGNQRLSMQTGLSVQSQEVRDRPENLHVRILLHLQLLQLCPTSSALNLSLCFDEYPLDCGCRNS